MTTTMATRKRQMISRTARPMNQYFCLIPRKSCSLLITLGFCKFSLPIIYLLVSIRMSFKKQSWNQCNNSYNPSHDECFTDHFLHGQQTDLENIILSGSILQ